MGISEDDLNRVALSSPISRYREAEAEKDGL
jgi:hypothetical protein